jgi:hypothetical protein
MRSDEIITGAHTLRAPPYGARAPADEFPIGDIRAVEYDVIPSEWG